MSYYKNCFKYKLTNHAKKRLKERTDFRKIEDHEIGYFIERIIEESIVETYCPNSDIIYNNLAKKLKIIVTKDNIVKTIINNQKK